jgi:hypothetical protein
MDIEAARHDGVAAINYEVIESAFGSGTWLLGGSV